MKTGISAQWQQNIQNQGKEKVIPFFRKALEKDWKSAEIFKKVKDKNLVNTRLLLSSSSSGADPAFCNAATI